jgi:hypothetical protein
MVQKLIALVRAKKVNTNRSAMQLKGEFTLYCVSHRVNSKRKRQSNARWTTVPLANKGKHVTKCKVKISQFNCSKLPFGGFVVEVSPKEHLKLMNMSKFVR